MERRSVRLSLAAVNLGHPRAIHAVIHAAPTAVGDLVDPSATGEIGDRDFIPALKPASGSLGPWAR